MANGGTQVYLETLDIYVAGDSGTSSLRPFIGTVYGAYANYAAQTTPTLKNMPIKGFINPGNLVYGFQSRAYSSGGRGARFGRRTTANGTTSMTGGDTYTWNSRAQGTYTYSQAPTAPANLAVGSVTNDSVTVSFDAPSDDGDTPITGYTLQISTESDFSSGVVTSQVTGLGPHVIDSLLASTDYWVRVAAKNKVTAEYSTSGVFSAGVKATTDVGVPGAPATTTLTQTSLDTVRIDWTPPANIGGSPILGYRVEYSHDPAFATLDGSADLGDVLLWNSPFLPGGDMYFRVRAHNAQGDGTFGSVVTNSIVRLGLPKVRVSGSWVTKPVKVDLGTMTAKPLKFFDGTQWLVVR